jgi:hypothetical protein
MLNAADPTMVEGPSSPGVPSRLETVSITERRISGAEEPRAMRDKFATVGFQTSNSTSTSYSLSSPLIILVVVVEVICSMAL